MQVVGLLVEQKRDWLSSVPFYIIYKRFVSIDLTVMSMAYNNEFNKRLPYLRVRTIERI